MLSMKKLLSVYLTNLYVLFIRQHYYFVARKIMNKYCDSKVLEYNWFSWLLARAIPQLEDFRKAGVLWTKVIGNSTDSDGNIIKKNGKTFADPNHPIREHCIAFGNPIYFTSDNGKIASEFRVVLGDKTVMMDLDALKRELSLSSDSEIHRLDNAFIVSEKVIPKLKSEGYIKEMPEREAWHKMLEDINSMCSGIATKFHPSNSEELSELTNEAILQVSMKLKNHKLVYTPGRAPVFNLLTTTIFRCLYSYHNKRSQQKRGMNKLLDAVQSGTIPDNMRSYKAGISLRNSIKN